MPIHLSPRQLRRLVPGRRRNVSASGQRAAQAEGGSFQARAAADAYTCGLTLWEIPSGCRWRGAGAPPIPVKTPFDVFGAVPWMGGRLICFDAKRVGPRSDKSGFNLRGHASPHQLNALTIGGEAGAVAGLLVECGPRGDVRWLDWRELRRPGNIVPWDDYGRWHLMCGIGGRIDFRALIEMFS